MSDRRISAARLPKPSASAPLHWLRHTRAALNRRLSLTQRRRHARTAGLTQEVHSDTKVKKMIYVGDAVNPLVSLWPISLGNTISLTTEGQIGAIIVLASPFISMIIVASAFAVLGTVQMRVSIVVGVLAILAISVNLRHRVYDDKSVDEQVVLRLVGIGALLIMGAPILARAWNQKISLAPLLWLLFLAFNILSSTYAQTPALSFIGSSSMLIGYLFAWNYVQVYGKVTAIKVMVFAYALLALASLAVYVALPDLGRLKDWENGVLVHTWRLQGVLGAPNGVGMSASVCILATFLFLRHEISDRLRLSLVVLFAVCLLLSNNRMAMATLAISWLFLFPNGENLRYRFISVLAVAIGVITLSTVSGEALVAMLSRSGSAEELVTVTGRSEIWKIALQVWATSPLFGLGFNSSLAILPNRDELFVAAAHTHNLFLEILFSTGLIGFLIFFAAAATTVNFAVAQRRRSELCMLAFFFLYGLTEPILCGIINLASIAFFSAVAMAHSGDPNEFRLSAMYQTRASRRARRSPACRPRHSR